MLDLPEENQKLFLVWLNLAQETENLKQARPLAFYLKSLNIYSKSPRTNKSKKRLKSFKKIMDRYENFKKLDPICTF